MPGLIGLGQGLQYVLQHGPGNIAQHESQLISRLQAGLENAPRIRTYGPSQPSSKVGVLSLNVEGHEPQEVAVMLDQAASIQGRAGFHCAPLIHQALKTVPQGGTLRLSCGPFTTEQEIDTTVEWLTRLAES